MGCARQAEGGSVGAGKSDGLTKQLSKRECATLQLLGRGMLLTGVARSLEVSESSAKTYARRATSKLGAATLIEAVVIHSRIHRRCPVSA